MCQSLLSLLFSGLLFLIKFQPKQIHENLSASIFHLFLLVTFTHNTKLFAQNWPTLNTNFIDFFAVRMNAIHTSFTQFVRAIIDLRFWGRRNPTLFFATLKVDLPMEFRSEQLCVSHPFAKCPPGNARLRTGFDLKMMTI